MLTVELLLHPTLKDGPSLGPTETKIYTSATSRSVKRTMIFVIHSQGLSFEARMIRSLTTNVTMI